MEKNGKKKYDKKNQKVSKLNIEFESFTGFGDLIDEVVGLGINKKFGAPFGDGGTLLHEWSKNSNLKISLIEYCYQN